MPISVNIFRLPYLCRCIFLNEHYKFRECRFILNQSLEVRVFEEISDFGCVFNIIYRLGIYTEGPEELWMLNHDLNEFPGSNAHDFRVPQATLGYSAARFEFPVAERFVRTYQTFVWQV